MIDAILTAIGVIPACKIIKNWRSKKPEKNNGQVIVKGNKNVIINNITNIYYIAQPKESSEKISNQLTDSVLESESGKKFLEDIEKASRNTAKKAAEKTAEKPRENLKKFNKILKKIRRYFYNG